MDWASAVTASYAGLWAATGKVAGGHKEHTDDSTINKLFYKTEKLDVTVETSVKGGEPGLPVDVWRHTLQYNSTWAVIDRDELIPVWTLLGDNDLASEFMKVWVQHIFAGSLTGLSGTIQKQIRTNLETTTQLDELFNHLTPQLELRVFTDSSPIGAADNKRYLGTLEVKVQAKYKLIGGGAHVQVPKAYSDAGKGNFLTASYPTDQDSWIAKCKDHGEGKECPATLQVWAVGLYDPDEKWDVKIFSQATEEEAQHPSVSARVDKEYVLTGGGAHAEAQSEGKGGSLLTKSYPMNEDGWAAESKDLVIQDKAKLTAYAIGIKPKNTRATGVESFPPLIKVFWAKSPTPQNHAEAVVRVPQGFRLISGGAHSSWGLYGHYLVGSYPDEDNTSWKAESWDHLSSEACTITAYAIGISSKG